MTLLFCALVARADWAAFNEDPRQILAERLGGDPLRRDAD